MDYYLFSMINGLAGRLLIADWVGIFFARVAVLLLPLMFFAAGAVGRTSMLRGGVAVLVALVVNHSIAVFYFRPRPFVDHAVLLLVPADGASKSFPSDHAAVAFAMAFTLFFAFPRAAPVVFVFAALIALSRVFIGVHYPSDIAIGALIGSASAFCIHLLSKEFGIL